MANGLERTICDGLSELVRVALGYYESERAHPSSDPDKMDDRIKFYRERAETLRRIREELEDEMARSAP